MGLSYSKIFSGRAIYRGVDQERNEGYIALFKGIIPKLITITPKLIFAMTISKKLTTYFEKFF